MKTKNREYYIESVKFAASIRAQLTYSFKVDQAIVDMMNNIIKLLESDIVNKDVLLNELDDFTHLIDVYSATEWNRIKTETAKSKKDKYPIEWFNSFEKNFELNKKIRNKKNKS